MPDIQSKIAALDWDNSTAALHQKGYALIPGLLTAQQCDLFKENYTDPAAYRKTVVMERYRYGLGEYRYFNYPLPELIQTLRTHIYPYLAPVANTWMKVLRKDKQFPLTHEELLQQCRDNQQTKATVLILKYGPGGYNALHQDLYGDIYFPIQLVLFLNEPDQDFSGGEFVLTEQEPRAQSKAIVLKPKKGDMLLFTTNFRPVKGSMGYYRVQMKHGVSEVHRGERYTLGIIFHDALS